MHLQLPVTPVEAGNRATLSRDQAGARKARSGIGRNAYLMRRLSLDYGISVDVPRLVIPIYRRLGLSTLRRAMSGAALRRNGGRVVNAAGITLFVDPADLRGRRLKLRRGSLDRNAIRLWNHLYELYEPDLAVDVGCNYGEVVFSRHYPPNTELHVVEANHKLIPFIEQTISEFRHPVQLHAGAASDRSGTLKLAIHTVSSGLTSISTEGTQTPSFRLDERIRARGRRIMFKLDVEGHEKSVLEGMSGLLSETSDWVGMCEVCLADGATIDFLMANFAVYTVSMGNSVQLHEAADAQRLRDELAHPSVSKDIAIRPSKPRPTSA